MNAVPPATVGVDTGGTFTDFVALRHGRLVAFKLLSTPGSPERAVLEGLGRLGVAASTRVRHGSTVATNALLERKGARVALLTTEGFEDLLEIGRQERPQLYALAPRRTPPLVPARRRIGVAERLGPRGEPWRPLTPDAVGRALEAARRVRPEAIAVGLLHAYANPRHERRLARALASLGVPVTLSSELCPEVREYERLSTVVLNAYLIPLVGRYLKGLQAGTRARLDVVLSHGGTATAREAAREPVRQLLSGPAAGLAAARQSAARCGFGRALTLDVGGTSTDCAFVPGPLPRRRAREVAGFPVLLPLLDVHTVGAGGGSIARVSSEGLLEVGPESAGADPGPACYGRGGPATVTDALVLQNRIPSAFLTDRLLGLDPGAAERALARLARTLGLNDALEAAEGVTRLAEAHIEAALRRVSVERGHDPRDAALVAFGGAGGLHACPVAEALGVGTVIAPRHAGMLSALGALLGGLRRERARSVLLEAGQTAELDAVWAALEREVRVGFDPRRPGLRLERWAEVRYTGQSHELSIPGGPRLAERFHVEHQRQYGFCDRRRAVEVVTLEARASLPGERPARAARGSRTAARPAGRVRVRHGGGWRSASVWNREELGPGFACAGPALALETGATLWIPPGWRARAHGSAALVLTRGRA